MLTTRIFLAPVLAFFPTLGASPALDTLAPNVPMTAMAATDMREEILVIVNGHIITRHQFQQAVEQEHAALYRQFSGKELDEKLKEGREKTLQGLIDSFLVEDKANDLGLGQRIGDDYLHAYVEDIKKQNNFATDADFEKALRGSMGIGLQEYLKRTKQQILQQEVLRSEVYNKIAIEDQELRSYYEDHKDEYKKATRFRIRELVLAKGATPQEGEAAKATLAKVQEELKAGKAFEDLVKQYSSSASKDTGGDLGWMEKGLMRPSIEQAALSLKAGAISAPIDTDKDIILVQLIQSENEEARPFAEVKAQIMEKLQEPKAQNAIQQYLANLRTRGNVRFMVPKDQILKG